MKALTKATIVIMLALSAQAAVFAQAPSTPAASVSVQDGEVVAVEPLVPGTPIGESNGESRPVAVSGWPPEHSTAGAVLVIPSTDMKSEDILAIMEDTSIMSRIFDKSLSQERLITPGTGTFDSLYSPRAFTGGPIFTSRRSYATEAMYLQGFGSLFFIGVDFPLSPPPKVQEDKPEEGVDTVWRDTKTAIYNPAESVRRRVEVQPQKEYDAERVQDLQKTIIKTLKHAANIRGLKTNEWVTIVVRSSAPAVIITGTFVTRSTSENSPAASNPSASLRTGVGTSSALPATEVPSQATFLTIRAKKSDIDSFAKDQLNYDQFCQRVQSVKY
jgi:hypothetical protein